MDLSKEKSFSPTVYFYRTKWKLAALSKSVEFFCFFFFHFDIRANVFSL